MADSTSQIRQGIAKCRERIAQMNAGARGIRPADDWRQTVKGAESIPAGGIAFDNQLRAQVQALERLELELLHAIIPKHGARKILELLKEGA